MNSTISHPLVDKLTVTVGPASRADWSAAQNAMSQAANSDAGMLLAGYNLLHSKARLAPESLDEAERIADAWPRICSAVYVQVFMLSGGLSIAPLDLDVAEREKYNAWRIDLSEVWGAARRMHALAALVELKVEQEADRASVEATREKAAKELTELKALHEEDLAALQSEGIDAAALERLARTFDDGALVCVRAREHGVFILRRPGFMAALDFASNGSGADPYAAVERLVLAAVDHPSPASMPEVIKRLPALASSLASEVRELLGGNVAAVVKKG